MRNSNQKNYNRQMAEGYIMYMMAGSYFKDGKALGSCGSLFLHYAEMPSQKQYQYEERVIKAMDHLDVDFLGKLSQLRCEVSYGWIDGQLVMLFGTGGFEGLCCRIKENGVFEVEPVNHLM